MISIDYSFIIVVLNFILLLVILNKMLYKPIVKFLSERQNKISSDMDEAKRAKQEASTLVDEKKKELKESAAEIRKLKNLAQKDAEKQASDIIKTAKTQEKRILKEAEDQLEHEKLKVVQAIQKDIAAMVATVSEKVLTEKMEGKADQELIQKMLSERGTE